MLQPLPMLPDTTHQTMSTSSPSSIGVDPAKLQHIHNKKSDGSFICRCPACNHEGGDSKGEHLIVYPPDPVTGVRGFACVLYPKDGSVVEERKEHRKLVLKLAGDHSHGSGLPATSVKRTVKITIRPKKQGLPVPY